MRQTGSMKRSQLFVGLALLCVAGCTGQAFSVEDRLLRTSDDAGALEEASTAEAEPPPADAGSHKQDAGDPPGHDSGSPPVHDAGASPDGATTDAPTTDASPPPAMDAGITDCECVSDLSNIGLGDFAIAFTITTTSTVPMAILNQETCTGYPSEWTVNTGTNGAYNPNEGVVYLQVHQQGINVFDDLSTQYLVNDGVPHRVVLSRSDNGTQFSLTVDGKGTPYDNIKALSLGQLAPLATGSDVCDTTAPLSGSLMNVCIAIGCVPN
jgi:hypothetical protein